MKYVFLCLFLVLSCSKKVEESTSKISTIDAKSNEIIVVPLNIEIGTTIQITDDSAVSFGQIVKGFKAIKQINIFNNKSESIVVNIDKIASNINLLTMNSACPSELESQRSCSITLEADSLNMNLGSFTQMIKINDLEIPITGEVIPNSNEEIIISNLNTANSKVIRGENVTRTYLVYNQTRNDKFVTLNHNFGSSAAFKGCGNQNLKSKRGCYIQAQIAGENFNPGTEQKEIQILDTTNTFNLEIENPVDIVENNLRPLSVNENIGVINGAQQTTRTITYVNASSKTVMSAIATASNPFAIDFANSSCLNKPVFPKRLCTIKVIADSTNLNLGNYNNSISFKSGINNHISSAPVNIEFSVAGNPCIGSKIQVNNACVEKNQSRVCSPQPINSTGGLESSTDGGVTFSDCENFTCNPQHIQLGLACVLKNQSRSCTVQPANSSNGNEFSTDGGQNFGSCVGYTCNPSYTNVNGSCLLTNQTRSCTVQPNNSTGGTESSSNGGVTFSSCSGYSCNPSYTNVNGSCVLQNQSRVCSPQPVNSTGGSETSSNGGVTFGSCSGYTCNPSYVNVNGSCVLANQTRSCSPQPVNSTGGLETSSNGGVTFSSCTGYTCNLNYMNVAGSCVLTNQTKTCDVQPTNSNGGYQESNNGGQTFGSCINYSCNSGFHNESSVCVSNTKSCFIANGSGTQTWNGSAWGACTVASCSGGYTQSGNSCIVLNYNVVCMQPEGQADLFYGRVCSSYQYYNTNVNFSGFNHHGLGGTYFNTSAMSYKFSCGTNVTSKSLTSSANWVSMASSMLSNPGDPRSMSASIGVYTHAYSSSLFYESPGSGTTFITPYDLVNLYGCTQVN